MKRRLQYIGKRVGLAVVIAAALFIVLDILFPVRVDVPYGQLVRAEDGTVLHAYLTTDEQWRMNARIDEITPELKKAIIFKEDKYFYYHPGVNLPAIARAVVNNVVRHRRTSGASTITMQVARMLNPKQRTYGNKLLEMFRALQLEVHYSKDRILQLYLNLVPYGSNIQGVKAAAILYFDKMPDRLSLAEITALSIIPNRPNSLVMGRNNKQIVQQRNIWLQRFGKAGLFSQQAIKDALDEPLTAYRHDAPKQVPQFAWRMHEHYPGLGEMHTTINPRMQQQAEDVVSSYISTLRLNNIHNCAVIIIDNKTHAVKTYIGSPDFSDEEHNGQVDGVMAARSPGSTLKPFLYGMCMDRGIVTPQTVIADVPIDMDGYMPENYDLEFHGAITIADALKRSLNIPAVKLLNRAGTGDFIKLLASGGVSTIWNERNNLGLSLILGGCTIRLDELSTLYASLANGGTYTPLKWTQEEDSFATDINKPAMLFSPAAAYMVTNIITDLYRPDLPNLSDNARNIPHIAWKTGTSYGRKDAWSVGLNGNYTIGVWVGNFDGTGVAELNGAGIATPLLFRLFNTVDRDPATDWLRKPESVQLRYVCTESGKLPGEACTQQVADLYIPGISANDICDHMKETWLSPDEDMSYCAVCRPTSGYKTKLMPNIPAELTAYYDRQHISYDKVPPHNPDCSRSFDDSAPSITSLTDNATYIITDRDEQQLQLQCTAANDVKTVYWYVNDTYIGSAAVGKKLFFCPKNRNIKISCADDKGRNRDIRITIKFI